MTFLAQRSGGTVISLESVPISQRMARAAVLYVAYLGKTVWPANLAALYPVGADGELLAGVGGGGLAGAAHRRGPVGGVARAAVAGRRLVLVSGHAYADDRSGAVGLEVMADRFLYLPQIGICVAVTWGPRMLPTFALSSLAFRGRRGDAVRKLARRVGTTFDRGQLWHPQTSPRNILAAQAPAVPPAFYSNFKLLVEYG